MAGIRKRFAFGIGSKLHVVLDAEAGIEGSGSWIGRLRSRLRGGRAQPRPPAVQPSPAPPVPRLREPAPERREPAPERREPAPERPQTAGGERPAAARARARTTALPSGDTSPSPTIFFVIGQGKSGTSWLMRTLDGHPEILCKGEGRFFGSAWRASLDPARHPKHVLSSLHYALSNSEDLKLWLDRSAWSKRRPSEEQLDDLVGLAVRYFLHWELARSGKKIVGDKTPLLSRHDVAEIGRALPDAKIVHIVRDGRDVAVSTMHHLWNRSTDRGGIRILEPEEVRRRETLLAGAGQVEDPDEGIFTEERLRTMAESWRDRVGKTMEDGRNLGASAYVEVHYEHLLERPHEEVAKLAGFLGAETSDEAVREAVSSASFERLSEGRSRGDEDPTSFYRKGISGDWRNHFTERDKEIFKEAAGELLVKLGYERNDDW